VWERTVGAVAQGHIGVTRSSIRSAHKENPMNTFSASPTMTLKLAHHTHAVSAQQTQARDALRALKAERRSARVDVRNPWVVLVRRFVVAAPAPSPAPRPLTAR
jgi:hypothetical protein